MEDEMTLILFHPQLPLRILSSLERIIPFPSFTEAIGLYDVTVYSQWFFCELRMTQP